MIDIHSHIISGIDDGSKDEAMSLKMLQKAVASGTTSIFATSHLLQAAHNPAWQDFLVGAERLRQLAGEHNLPLAIYSGCEVFMDWDLLDIIAENGSFCLNGENFAAARTSYILVELPMYFIPNYADDFWYELRLKGVVPILAHPERYTELMTKLDLLLRWRREGLLLQCNIGSFAGSFGAQAEQAAKLLLASGLVDFVGSDAHRDSGRDTDMRAWRRLRIPLPACCRRAQLKRTLTPYSWASLRRRLLSCSVIPIWHCAYPISTSLIHMQK